MIIWIVRKHPVVHYGYHRGGVLKAFEIHSVHATRKEAAAVAKLKEKKAQKFTYMVGKVQLKDKNEN
jgi:hypothetical protein